MYMRLLLSSMAAPGTAQAFQALVNSIDTERVGLPRITIRRTQQAHYSTSISESLSGTVPCEALSQDLPIRLSCTLRHAI